jgi:hypothetical protein
VGGEISLRVAFLRIPKYLKLLPFYSILYYCFILKDYIIKFLSISKLCGHRVPQNECTTAGAHHHRRKFQKKKKFTFCYEELKIASILNDFKYLGDRVLFSRFLRSPNYLILLAFFRCLFLTFFAKANHKERYMLS